jgi:hypothetical protein
VFAISPLLYTLSVDIIVVVLYFFTESFMVQDITSPVMVAVATKTDSTGSQVEWTT